MAAEEAEQRWVAQEMARLELERSHKRSARTLSAFAADAALRRDERLAATRKRELAALAAEDQLARALVASRDKAVKRDRISRMVTLRHAKARERDAGVLGRSAAAAAVAAAAAAGGGGGDSRSQDHHGLSDLSCGGDDDGASGYVRGFRGRAETATFARRCRRVRDSVALLRARRARQDVEQRLREIHDRSVAMLGRHAGESLGGSTIAAAGANRSSLNASTTAAADVRRAVLLGSVPSPRANVASAIRDDEFRTSGTRGSHGDAISRVAGNEEPFWDTEDPLAYRFATGNVPKCLMRSRRARRNTSGSPRRVGSSSVGGGSADGVGGVGGSGSGSDNEEGTPVLHPLNSVAVARDTVYNSPLRPLFDERAAVYDERQLTAAFDSRSAIVFDAAEPGRARVLRDDPVMLQAERGAREAVAREARREPVLGRIGGGGPAGAEDDSTLARFAAFNAAGLEDRHSILFERSRVIYQG
jgi:hypothetical protein